MFNSMHFSFDGVHSTDKGVFLVREEDGFFERPVSASRTIIKEKSKSRNIPTDLGMEYEDLRFTLCICQEEAWTQVRKREIIKWIIQSTYKPLISDDDTGIVYYCKVQGSPTWKLDTFNQGYLRVEMECDSAFAYTNIIEYQFDLFNNETMTEITIDCQSNILDYYYPELQFKMVGDGDISFKNISDGGLTLTFTNLDNEEIIYVDNDKGQLMSDTYEYRLGDCNREWFRLVYGINTIQVTGKAFITFRCQYPIAI